MSFRARILAALALVLAVNAAVMAFVTIDQARRAFRRDSEARLGATARAAANEVDEWGRSLALRTRDLSTRPDVLDMLDGAAGGGMARDDPRLVSLASRVMGSGIDRLLILAADGTVFSAAPDRERFGTELPQVALAATAGESPNFLLSLDGRTYLGAVARASANTFVIALIEAGDDLARGLATSTGVDVWLQLDRHTYASGPGADILAGQSPSANDITHVEAGSIASAELEEWDGEVRVLRRSDVLDSLRRDLVRTVPVVVGLSLLVLWPLALFIARRLGRPVEALTTATARVAAGEWDRPVAETGGPREFDTLIASFNDMQTELLRQRDELRRAERAGAWRDAARRMAHEIKNALTPIQLAWERVRRGDDAEDAGAESVEQEIASLRQLLIAFHDLAEWPEPALRNTDVSDLVSATVALYAPTTSASISVDAPDPVHAEVDPGQISRAVSNLLQNAIEAAGEGGTISVNVRAERDRVVVVVADDGPGLEQTEQADVFMPYYTTKSAGTGLGLAIVERVADAHGGSARFESAPGAGTRVTLTLARER